MSAKRNINMATDLVMTMLLPVLMAYSLVGEAIHEWLGIVMFLLFIIHHAFNWRWYKNLAIGSYPPISLSIFGQELLLRGSYIYLPLIGDLC